MLTDVPAAFRRDVRLLSTALGRVLEETDGPELLADVERLRRATIAARRASGSAPCANGGPTWPIQSARGCATPARNSTLRRSKT